MKKKLFYLFVLLAFYATSQNLTIVSSGGTSEGTTWSYSNGVITTISDTSVNASDVESYLATGDLTIEAGNIWVGTNVNSTSANALTLKSLGLVNLNNTYSITTTGGAVTFWADSDGSGEGYVQLGSSTGITTVGGNITLGGGLDIATGYARGAAELDAETDNVNQLHISGVHLKNGASLSSGGGNITLRGQNYPSSVLTMDFGVMGHNATLDAGSGKVAIIGKATGSGTSNTQAISVYGNGWTIRSSNSDADAIVLDGDGSGYNGTTTSMGINFTGIIESTGGGDIQLTGKSGTSTGYDHPLDMSGSILANSGTITITAENNDATQFGLYLSGATFGFKAATNVTASTSNIILKSDNTVFNSATNLNTTGAVSLLPLDASTSFGVGQTIGSNMVLASGVSGLTIGKEGNTADVTLTSAQTIAGPIAVFGNSVRVEQNLTSTGTNTPIRIVSQGVGTSGLTNGFISLSSSKNITTSGGDIILWSNAQNITSGQANNEIVLGGTNTLITSGGKIVIAGGLDNDADNIPDGYAYRGSYFGEAIDIRTSVTLNSGGGDIIIRGEQNGSDTAVGTDATFTISNGGAVTIEGKNTTATSVNLGTANITSTATNAPVSITGTTHITNSGPTTITTAGGDVLLASNTDDATDGEATINGYIRMLSGLSVITNGGAITLGGGNATGTAYALGSTASTAEGIRIDGTVNLNSGNGNIALRGKSAAVAVANNVGGGAVMFYNVTNGSINSGTGTVLLDGYSQTTGGNAIAGLLWWNDPTASTFTIQSANTTTSAITLNGYTTSSSGQSYGLEVEATNTLNVYATGTGGGISINGGRAVSNTTPNENLDIVFRGPVNILANSGPISIKGGQLGGVSNGYWFTTLQTQIGSSAARVTSSASDITIVFDRFWFDGNYYPKLATTGTVTIAPLSTGFGMGVSSSWFQYNQNSQTMTGLTLGKVGNTANINHDTNAITAAGPVSIYGGILNINSNITSSTASDISLYAANNVNMYTPLVTLSTAGGNILLNSNTDDNGGAINLDRVTLASNGGNISLVGGSDGSGYAQGINTDASGNLPVQTLLKGIFLNGTYLNATGTSSGGNILLRGKGWQGTANTTEFLFPIGIDIVAYNLNGNTRGTAFTTNGAGTITLDGIGGNQNNNTAHNVGINLYSAISAANIISSESGAISIKGTAGDQTLSSLYAGFNLDGGVSNIYSTSGNITIEGVAANSTDIGIRSAGTLNMGWDGTNAGTTGNIVLSANSITSTNSINVNARGTLTVQPNGTSFDNALSWPIANSTLGSGLTGLTIGKQTNTSTVTISSAQSIAGPISVYGGAIAVSANLTATGGNILLDADLGGSGLPTGSYGINVGAVAIQTITSGDITIIGRSGNGNVSNVMGYFANAGAVINSAGALSITGYSNSTSNTGTRGFLLRGTYTAKDDITLTGADDTGDDATFGGVSITSTNGAVNLNAEGPFGSFYTGGTNSITAKQNITFNANGQFLNLATIAFDTDGQVKILPKTGSSAFSTTLAIGTGVTFNAGITGLTVGGTENTADINLNRAISIAGPITAYGGNITVGGNLNTASGGSSGDILLKAAGNITQSTGIDVTTDGADVIYWSDSDEDNAGYINFTGSGYDIVTNGGNVIMAGGAGTTEPTGYAHGGTAAAGVNFLISTTSAKIDTRKTSAVGGNIIIRGKTSGAYSGIYTENIQFFGNNLTFDGETGSTGTNDYAVRLGSTNVYNGTNLSQVIDVDNDLTITGVNTAASYTGKTLRTGANPRVYADGNITINSSGALNYTSNQTFLNINPGKTLSVNFDGTANFTTKLGDPNTGVAQGKLSIASYLQDSFTSSFNNSVWTFNSNLSGITIGKPTNTSAVTISKATDIAGPIAIFGGDLSINAGLTVRGNDVNLHATGAVTQTAALTADGLGLHGTGTFTLQNASNNVTTIAGGDNTTKLGSLSFVDAADGLTVGSVNPTGIYSDGVVELATLSGDLMIEEPIVSILSSGDAVKLYSDKDATAGNEGDGNIKITDNGAITIESGARALLYSGKESESTGVQTEVGGETNTRTQVGASTDLATINPVLGNSGLFALFRTSKPLTVTSVQVPVDANYSVGQTLSFLVIFDDVVTVSGQPRIPITVNEGGTVYADYVSGSGTNSLLFNLNVRAGLADSDGISVGTDVDLNSGSIKDGFNIDANLTLNNVPSTAYVRIGGLFAYEPFTGQPNGTELTGTSGGYGLNGEWITLPTLGTAVQGVNKVAISSVLSDDSNNFAYPANVNFEINSANIGKVAYNTANGQWYPSSNARELAYPVDLNMEGVLYVSFLFRDQEQNVPTVDGQAMMGFATGVPSSTSDAVPKAILFGYSYEDKMALDVGPANYMAFFNGYTASSTSTFPGNPGDKSYFMVGRIKTTTTGDTEFKLKAFTPTDNVPSDESTISWDVTHTENLDGLDLTHLLVQLESKGLSELDEVRIGSNYLDVVGLTLSAPIDVLATISVNGSSADISFSPSASGAATITGYVAVATSIDGSEIISNNGTNSTITISGLDPAKNYRFKVAAINAAGIGAYGYPPPKVAITSSQINNNDATVQGTWESNLYPNAVLTVIVKDSQNNLKDTFTYSNANPSSATNGIVVNGVNWDISVSGYALDTYTVTATVTDNQFGSGFDTGTFEISKALSIGEDMVLGSLCIYPNPAKEMLYVKNPYHINFASAAIYDLQGRLVKNINVNTINSGIHVYDLDTSSYFIILKTSDNKKIIKQFIKR
ncbi:fibronectin type III domain-containing protein [Siansivirga zeaxanthinifaciens]|uniref:Fibronectin type-III domain-containing protein n=1 Tax=Siansivirga zeaxanthinifaciens CC-SAMT-1 TaxID=1454006 RepID=A0A0C5WFR0_9FLAO|nr:fibronectin type III domain-containing protein [Siansivirga zeaxanthinifaciens]AJR05027.1 hypothetical protein AW14_14730 [Siansivirga zeaxanthinifaciens CC-SAMT-1]